jgi:hypothetical protein
MFMTHTAPPNGLDPGDRMPGTGESLFDPMDGLMSDWSWRPRRSDLAPPVYVYSWQETVRWDMHNVRGLHMPAQQPWSFPAYRGLPERPQRIGVTR